MTKLKNKFLMWLMKTKFYSCILMHVIPYIRFTTYYTSMRGWKYMRGYSKLQPGDIILTIDRKKLTTMLIGGEFTHAALCVDKGSEWEVSEMTHTDYTKSCFFDICKESDRVVVLRCHDFDQMYVHNSLLPACRALVNATYDCDFSLGVESLYCSELVYQSDVERRLQVSLEDLAGLGRPYISPTGLWKAKNVEVVWDSDVEVREP